MTSDLEDALAAAFPDSTGPGCVVGIVRDGSLSQVGSRGMANVEHAIPLSSSTVFHVASVSKQFTAYAIALLAQAQQIDLDSPVAKHLDWFPFPSITVRHLVHHVSGLRDQWDLICLSGRRMDDVITIDHIVSLLQRQSELNFPPGTQHLYSNSNYTVLRLIVEAVTGQSLQDYCSDQIFTPLGMSSTQFVDNYRTLIPGRADSYVLLGETYQRIALSYSAAGATSLNTTVDDLARWALHVMRPEVRVLFEQQITLSDGSPVDYAFGVTLREIRGAASISHSGSDAAFLTGLTVFPDRGIATIILSNRGDVPAFVAVDSAVLDAAVGPRSAPRSNKEPVAEWRPTTAQLEGLAGRWFDASSFTTIDIRVDGDTVHLRQNNRNPFVWRTDAEVALTPTRDGVLEGPPEFAAVLELTPDGPTYISPKRKPPTLLQRVDVTSPAPNVTGTFWSSELHSTITLSTTDDTVVLEGPMYSQTALERITATSFITSFPNTPGLRLHVEVDSDTVVLTTQRCQRLRFHRIALPDNDA